MLKKVIAVVLIAAIVFSMIPNVAYAGNITINSSGTYNIASYADGSLITVNPGLKVMFTNPTDTVRNNLQIVCGEGVDITLNNITIYDEEDEGACALSFTGSSNKLTLLRHSILKSGSMQPGIKAEEGTSLEITGTGSIEAKGGQEAAGIGGGSGNNGGTLLINGGEIVAFGGYIAEGVSGAGIGGGLNGSGGRITIADGYVNAVGGKNAACIGGGANGDAGTITIDGGTVVASSVYNSTGIGAGNSGSGGTIDIRGGTITAMGTGEHAGIGASGSADFGSITIQGGTVTATGGVKSSAIGGGPLSTDGSISISGGIVFAQKGEGAPYDIGDGYNGSGATFEIGGDSAVFLKNGHSINPQTDTHTLRTAREVINSTAFGYTIPESWSAPVYAYIILDTRYDLNYDINGGEGTAPASKNQYEGTVTKAAEGNNLTKGEAIFWCWNTQPDGLGTEYYPGDEFVFTADTTLYAHYIVPVRVTSLILSSEAETLRGGSNLKLTAAVSPENATYPNVTWSSSNENVAVVDNNGLVTAVSPGIAVITATADGVSDACDITVEITHAASITLSTHSVTMMPGTDLLLHATVLPVNTSYPEITWTSDDETVATVNQSGAVTAVGLGRAIIAATADGLFDTCVIAVVEQSYTVSFNSQGGGSVPGMVVPENSLITEPDEPQRAGYTFEGWYKDQRCADPWDFNTDIVAEDVTLWAEWTQDGIAFSGSGTELNPYRIIDAEDLAMLAAFINAGDLQYNDKYYLQVQDIDLSAYQNWTPIGTGESPLKEFKGAYEGNSKNITGLNINITDSTHDWVYVGLFGYVRGTVKNINLESGEVCVTGSKAINAGCIIGYLVEGVVENCSNKVNITAQSNASNGGRVSVGGIVGCAYILGKAVSNCSNSGNILGFSESEAIAGGIIGLIDGHTQVSNCTNFGNILSKGKAYSGGIIGISRGYSPYLNICESYNMGSVSVSNQNDSRRAGGIVGYASATRIIDCFNIGRISENQNGINAYVGGIVGEGAYAGFYLRNCYNIGLINGGAKYGGIAGMLTNTSAVSSSYYADTCTVGIGSGSGSAHPKTFDELKLQETYSGFDFDTVWTMGAEDETGYGFAQLQENLFYAQRYNAVLEVNEEEGTVQGTGKYVPFSTISITATAKEQYVFKNWVVTGGEVELENVLSPTTMFVMPDADVSILAVFEKVKYNVSVESGGNGTAEGNGSYSWSSTVPITATANSGYQFLCWEVVSGEIELSDASDMTADFSMPQSDVIIRAVFGPDPAGYTYKVTGDQATIIGYTGSQDSAAMPSRIGGYRVTAIGDDAFRNETGLKSIIIPDTVKSIGDGAFYGCTSLTLISLGKDVNSIGDGAFSYCSSLKNISVSSENTYYKNNGDVLYNKTGTDIICCPAGIEGEFSIPAGVVSIRDYAFFSCTRLTSVQIPDTAINIGSNSFSGCYNLKSVVIPDSVTNIGSYAFYGCYSLENATLGDNIESIGERAFYSCDLGEMYFPQSLKAIGNNAFSDNTELVHSYFLGGLPELGTIVFSNTAGEFIVNYHVCEAESWQPFYLYPKQAFCLLIMEPQNGEPESTSIVYLDSLLRIPMMTEPLWEDHTFAGWYKDADATDAWDFEKDIVTDDITLYAKWTDGPYEIKGLPNNSSYGKVTGSGKFNAGSTGTLRAEPEDGCRFVRWTKDGITLSAAPDHAFIVYKNCTYIAEFEEIDIPIISSIDFIGNSSIRIEWTKVLGAAGYEIWRSEESDGEYNKIADTKSVSYTDSRLYTNTTYYYAVKAYCTAGTITTYSDESDIAFQKSAPLAPAAVSAVSAGYEAISISWSKVIGARGYQIFRSTAKSGTYSLIYTTPSTNYTNTGLKTGTSYYYKVRAYDDTGSEDVSSDFSEPVFTIPVPKRVAGLRCSPNSVTTIKLSWQKVSGNDGYEIWRSESGDSGYKLIKTVRGTSYSNTGVIPNTTYYYKVRAYRKVGKRNIPGDFSEAVSARCVLSSVTGITAAVSSATKIKINWKSVSGRSGYEVFRSTSMTGVFTSAGRTTKTYLYDENLTPNTTYYYKVKAYRTINGVKHYSEESDVKSARPVFNTVSGVSASMYSVTSNKITWNAVSGRKGYEIWRSEAPGSGYSHISTTTKTYYTDKNLVPNKTYYYRIRAYVMAGKKKYYSEFSDTKSAMPVFGPVKGVTASMYSATSNKITWGAVSGRKGYEIWRSESPGSGYSRISTTTKTYYTDKNLVPNKTYYYRIKAYVMAGKKKCYSEFSDTKSAMPVFGPVTGAAASAYSATSSKLIWNAVSGRSGYEILRAAAPDGAYTVIGSASGTYYYDKKCLPGTTYYYKVRAYVTVKNVRYTAESKPISVTPH